MTLNYNYLAEKYKGKIHISLGMTKNKEVNKIFNFLKKKKKNNDIIFYICTSDYPYDFKDLNLLELKKIKKKFKNKIYDFAFSGHHLGIAPDIAALTLGARYIERHFTLDRTWKGTDHAASLEPSGLAKLRRDLNNTFSALNFKQKEISDCENFQRNKLKKFVNI